MRRTPSSLLSCILSCVLFASAAHAQIFDHLQCYKIKDELDKAKYTASLTPGDLAFPNATGCEIKVPAKLLCVDVQKTNVDPVPPGSAAGANAQRYLCYKLKCPKLDPEPTANLQDQFGARLLTVKKSGFICAPASPPCTDADEDTFCAETDDCDDADDQVNPSATESCNGVDDDCDGQSDEGLGTITCGTGQCQTTVDNCLNGTPQTCTPGAPTAEVCNGADDNCNGVIDDGLGTTTCGTGQCLNSVSNCLNGEPQTCTPNPAGTEVCDSIDNDCDGLIDENAASSCPPRANATATCTAGQCGFTCNAQFRNCDGNSANGCEINTSTDVSNCGNCGLVCQDANQCTINTCSSGVCFFPQAPNGTSCGAGMTCQSGVCQ